MNKAVKGKLIGSVICIVIAIMVILYLVLDINGVKNNEELSSYIAGFACGIFGVGIVVLYIVIKATRNSNKAKELENTLKDERLNSIKDKTMAVVLKISLFSEAIISLFCAFTNNMEIAKYLGLAISAQLITFSIVYILIKRNN